MLSEGDQSWLPAIALNDPPANLGRNYAIGCRTEGEHSMGIQPSGFESKTGADSWYEHEDEPVAPRSLYLAQLRDRRGWSSVVATTTKAQRELGADALYAALDAKFSGVPEFGPWDDLSWLPALFSFDPVGE